MADILDEVRKAERDALSPSNRDFYKRCADEIERLRAQNVGADVGRDLTALDADATQGEWDKITEGGQP